MSCESHTRWRLETPVEKSNLDQIAAFASGVADMQRLVEIGDKMNQEFQCLLFFSFVGLGAPKHTLKILDLADDTSS
jgi:hypothetical protein